MHLKFFPAYFDRPDKIRFSEQEEDEVIELMLRQHWIVNVPWIFFATLAIILPFLLFNYRSVLGLDFIVLAPPQLLAAVLTLWYLLILAYIIENFLHWYFNIYIVTNMHLIDVDFESLLGRNVIEAGIEQVESASAKIMGIIQSLFNFGDVVVETAAKTQAITFAKVPYPDLVVDRINDLKEQIRKEAP